MRWFLVSLILFGSLMADPEKKVLFISVPKAGTHLLKKAAEKICGGKLKWISLRQFASADIERTLLKAPQRYFLTHLFSETEYIPQLDPNLVTKVLLIRDPRDVMVSFHNHILAKKPWPFSKKQNRLSFHNLSYDEQFATIFQFPPFGPGDAIPVAAKWVKDPSFIVIRFEDLVGEKGGGSDDAQREALNRLANAMGLALADEKLTEIQNSLFGGTWTFHRGQIGAWHMAFTHQNRALYQLLFGQATIDLGYAENLNW